MKVVESERIVFCDCDDTLVMHHKSKETPEVRVINPFDKEYVKDNRTCLLYKNMPMIRLLKEEKQRGAYIIVWSRGGFAWAKAVVEALKLETYVDQVMSKPLTYMDDKDISEWLKDRVYIGPDVRYKR